MKRLRLKSSRLPFLLFRMIYFALVASFTMYTLAYFSNVRGLTSAQTSICMTVNAIGGFAGQFLFGRLCDILRTHKKVYIGIQTGLLISLFLCYYARDYISILITYSMVGFFVYPIPATTDTWYIDSGTGDPSFYGKILAAGAVGFGVMGYGMGAIIDKIGYVVMIYAAPVIVVIGILVACFTKDASAARTEDRKIKRSLRRRAIKVTKEEIEKRKRRRVNPYLILFMPALLLMGVCGMSYNLNALFLNRIHADVYYVGVNSLFSMLGQLPVQLLSGKLEKWPPRLRLILGGVMYVSCVLCYAFAKTPTVLIIGCFISGIGWGFLYQTYREEVVELSEPSFRTTAQSVSDAMYLTLGGVSCSLMYSVLCEPIGHEVTVGIMAACGLVATILFAINPLKRLSKEPEVGEGIEENEKVTNVESIPEPIKIDSEAID